MFKIAKPLYISNKKKRVQICQKEVTIFVQLLSEGVQDYGKSLQLCGYPLISLN
jgi:hypothetical protein